MRLQKLLPLLFVIVLAGCGGEDSPSSSGSGPDPATAIAAGVPVYVEAVVRPEGEQGDNVRELLSRFLGEKSVTELLDEALEEEDKTYAEDIEPWLGEKAGIGVSELEGDEPLAVGVLQVTDADAAEEAIAADAKELATYEGVKLYQGDDSVQAVTEDFFLIADSREQIEAAIDGPEGQSLADDQAFKDAVDGLPEERLGSVYVDTRSFGEAIAADPSLDPAARGVLDQFFGEDAPPITAALTTEPDSATIESRLPSTAISALGPFFTTGEAPDLVADAPAGTWAVIGYSDVGATLKTTLETFAGALGGAAVTGQFEQQTGLDLDRDVFGWIGDLSVFVRGDSLQSIDGALVIEASDADAAEAAIPRIVEAARKSGAPISEAQIDGADEAYSVPIPGAPGPLVLASTGERVVLSIGEQAAADGLNPTETIADSGLYERAKGTLDGIAPSAIVDFATVLRFAEGVGATDDPDYAEAKPYLDQLDLLATGAEEDGDEFRSLFTLKIKE